MNPASAVLISALVLMVIGICVVSVAHASLHEMGIAAFGSFMILISIFMFGVATGMLVRV